MALYLIFWMPVVMQKQVAIYRRTLLIFDVAMVYRALRLVRIPSNVSRTLELRNIVNICMTICMHYTEYSKSQSYGHFSFFQF